ncbi:MAG: GNAT family N-acyltransferase, partial [Rikenellaceae bacterium]
MTEKEPVIQPVPVNKILAELQKVGKIRTTQRGGNDIYIIDYHTSPLVMQEIGRLREETFRAAGGGTGKSVDIDEEDMAEDGYKQLIVFDPESNEIIGGYRFIVCFNSHPKHLS